MDILSEEEKELLHSPQIFKAKRSLEKKLFQLLENTGQTLESGNQRQSGVFPEEVVSIVPKVSRGENYLGYPWLVLDYPRYFTKSDVFAIRTFCWWTQGISITLQLSGKYLEQYLPVIASKAELLITESFYFGIHTDPWVHHFERENYVQPESVQEIHQLLGEIRQRGFLKLMKRIPLEDLNGLSDHVIRFFELTQLLCSSRDGKSETSQ